MRASTNPCSTRHFCEHGNQPDQGRGFGFFAYDLNPTIRISLIASVAASNSQLPNQPNLDAFELTGAAIPDSANTNSYLDFRDYMENESSTEQRLTRRHYGESGKL